MKKALVILVLLSFCQSWMQASRARAANKSSCESCPVPGVDFKSTTALIAATKSSGCKVGKGNAGLPVLSVDETPSDPGVAWEAAAGAGFIFLQSFPPCAMF